MNKNTLLLAITPLMTLGIMSGCSSSSTSIVSLPFGRLYDSSISSINPFDKITYADLSTLVSGDDSATPTSFVLVVRGSSEDCICWTSFAKQIDKYCSKTNLNVYLLDLADISSQTNYYGLDLKTNEHTLAVFEKGSLKYQVNVTDGSTYSSNYDVLSAWLSERVSVAPLLYINKTQLDALYTNSDSGFAVGYVRKTCPDCSYVLTHSLFNYSSTLTKISYLLDCDVDGVRLVNGASPKEDGTDDQKAAYIQWNSFKDEYGLSNKNTAFGFDDGYVPTFTYSLPGEGKADGVKDAFVWGNEGLTANGDGTYKVTNAYLDGTRNDGEGEDNPFLTDGGEEILTKYGVKETNFLNIKSIPSSDVTIYGEDAYWNHSASSVYDDPLLQSFLTYYCTK